MASKVVKEATTIRVKDETTQIINPEAKKMADEIESKMKKEMEKARSRTLTALWFCSFILVGAVGVIIESAALLKIPKSHDSPLALNHYVLSTFLAASSIAMFLALTYLAIQVIIYSNMKRKSSKTKLLVNLMRKANQGAEDGALRSAVEELNQEYREKQKKLKKTRGIIVIVTGIFVMWIGVYAATLGVAERFFHPTNKDVLFEVLVLLPDIIIPLGIFIAPTSIIIIPLIIVLALASVIYCCFAFGKDDKPNGS